MENMLSTPASRVTFWEDIAEGGKIVLTGTVGGVLTGTGVSVVTYFFDNKYGIHSIKSIADDTLSYASAGLMCSIAWSLAARWGSETEKLGWRTFVKPMAILGICTVVHSFLLDEASIYSFLLAGGIFILGRMYGKREPATQAVHVRPDRVSFNLMTLLGDTDDL